ncbi:MAG TPA: D-alanyl-D-alanine carboxypeptidase family protein [Acidimicrobiales bacterium]|nr:D-alanyl-D-alanine carboxypeptidase family protein [Acidimicrobiales bacterium]
MARALVIAAVGGALLAPDPTAAQEPSAEEQREAVRDQGVAVAAELDVLNAQDAEVQAALAAIQTQVAGQQVVVNQTTDALATADAAVAASEAEIAALETEITDLDAEVDRIIVEAYVDPPVDHALDMFDSDTLADATVKNGLVGITADQETATIERLERAEADLEVEKAGQEELAAEAATKQDEATAAMADLNAALDVQAQLASEVDARISAKQAEANLLRESDAQLSAQIAAEQAALAASVAAAREQAAGGSTVQPAPGGLATVSCPVGGSITVAGSIAGNVQALLDAAWADGIGLCGGGYRDPQEQIELRMAHCGTSYYDIYEAPSSSCSPPTAQPGSSMHELGLAIDFTCDGGGTLSSGSPCFSWLSANAATYGLANLPSEPWHWSTNGN